MCIVGHISTVSTSSAELKVDKSVKMFLRKGMEKFGHDPLPFDFQKTFLTQEANQVLF